MATVKFSEDSSLPSLCSEHDRLTGQIAKMLEAPSCPSNMREVVDARRSVKVCMETRVNRLMSDYVKGGLICLWDLVYFNSWFNLRGGFGKD
jgi:hypothetical protein